MSTTAPEAPATSRWRQIVRAVEAVRSTDPGRVQAALQTMGERSKWLKPLAYAAGTVAVVFDGVVLLLRNWKLTLLQLLPAVWIWLMTWNLKSHLLSDKDLPDNISIAAAICVPIAAQIVYWCNATFAFTMLQGEKTDIRAAFREARPRWRLISGLALLTGGLQGAVWLAMPHMQLKWFWLALLILFVVQVYLFVAIPAWLLEVKKTKGPRREKTLQTATTGVLSGVAATPGFILNRIGLLLMGVSSLWIIGVVVVAIAAVLHVTASTSVRVVKMSLKLKPAEKGAPAPSDVAGPPAASVG